MASIYFHLLLCPYTSPTEYRSFCTNLDPSMASSSQQAPTSSTALQASLVDIKYRLIYQSVQGVPSRDVRGSTDYIHIKVDTASHLNARLPSNSNLLVCRIHFAWEKHSGDLSGAYDRAEDTLISSKLLQETMRRDAGADGEISDIGIALIKERTQNGALVNNGGRYVRLDVRFTGPPAYPARIWGKSLTGANYSEIVRFSAEEKLRLGIEGKKWRWKSD